MEQLASASKSDNPDDIFDSAAILRLLILDKQSLCDVVNSSRMPICFRIVRFFDDADDEFPEVLQLPDVNISSGNSLYPNPLSPNRRIHLLNKDQFLREGVMKLGQHTITVRDVIKYISEKAGAIHYDSKPSKFEEIRKLKSWNQSLFLNGAPPALVTLQAIGQVVGDGLRPLYNSLKV